MQPELLLDIVTFNARSSGNAASSAKGAARRVRA
jgi:hypothetical protein